MALGAVFANSLADSCCGIHCTQVVRSNITDIGHEISASVNPAQDVGMDVQIWIQCTDDRTCQGIEYTRRMGCR